MYTLTLLPDKPRCSDDADESHHRILHQGHDRTSKGSVSQCRGEKKKVASCRHDMHSLSGMSAHPRDRQAQVGLWALPVRLKPRRNTSQASQKRGCSFGNPGYKTPSALGLPRWFGAGSPGGIKGYASLDRLAGFLEVALGLTSPPGFATPCSLLLSAGASGFLSSCLFLAGASSLEASPDSSEEVTPRSEPSDETSSESSPPNSTNLASNFRSCPLAFLHPGIRCLIIDRRSPVRRAKVALATRKARATAFTSVVLPIVAEEWKRKAEIRQAC